MRGGFAIGILGGAAGLGGEMIDACGDSKAAIAEDRESK